MLFTDVVHAFAQIQAPIEGAFPDSGTDGQYVAETTSFQEGLALLTDAYESSGGDSTFDILGETVLPRFVKWREAVERMLLPYVSS